eukprot:8360273-Heterocapsa_arctica.AAC.1
MVAAGDAALGLKRQAEVPVQEIDPEAGGLRAAAGEGTERASAGLPPAPTGNYQVGGASGSMD